MNSTRIGLFLAGVLVAGFAGCAHTPSRLTPGPVVSGFGGSCDQCNRFPNLPRGRLTPAPVPVPGPPVPVPGNPPPGPPPGGTVDNFRPYQPPDRPQPPSNPAWKPGPDTRFYNPDVRPPNARLQRPEVGENVAPQKPIDSILPVDIPGFAIARKDVSSGQTPFPEGLEWLRNKGYKTVLYVKAPGEDDRRARQQFEAKGFRYIGLDVSAVTLNRDVIEEFNRIVTDPALPPLFVYDRDSSLAGGMWYLHFRTHEGYNDEKAAIEAGRLGLNIDADGGSHRDMWLAIQRYLQNAKPMSSRPGKIHMVSWDKTQP